MVRLKLAGLEFGRSQGHAKILAGTRFQIPQTYGWVFWLIEFDRKHFFGFRFIVGNNQYRLSKSVGLSAITFAVLS